MLKVLSRQNVYLVILDALEAQGAQNYNKEHSDTQQPHETFVHWFHVTAFMVHTRAVLFYRVHSVPLFPSITASVASF